nr:4031_t:CDS:2 [Entrophospora candida]
MSSLFHDYTQDMALIDNTYYLTEDYNLKKDDNETRSTGRKIDIVWCIEPIKLEFAIGEISGSPNQRCHSHFFDDKLKIAKVLKVMLNKIVRTYSSNSSMLNHLNLYGVQSYNINKYILESRLRTPDDEGKSSLFITPMKIICNLIIRELDGELFEINTRLNGELLCKEIEQLKTLAPELVNKLNAYEAENEK